ncbi:MAG: DNA polymerase III subunit delta [Oscillospiraceae bacterium]|nr:DNA polymerase III subunit delta [Oscillospiraceae bacterium]
MAGKFNPPPKLEYGALTRELKNEGPGTLYMLWGEEDYLLQDFVRRLRDACLEGGAGDFDAKRLDGPAPDVRDVEEALDAMPFFGGRTFLELRGFDVNKCRDERMAKILDDIPEWCTVVIVLPTGAAPDGRLSFIKQLKKKGKAVEFTSQDSGLLYTWIRRRCEAHGKKIGRDAMDRLMFLSGELMTQLIPEIEKICAWAKEEYIRVEDVEAVAHHIPEADAFKMTDCLARKDYDGACAVLAELLAGDEEPLMILGLIGGQMRSLYAAKVAETSGRGPAFAKEILGTSSDYRVRLTMDTARKFTLDALTDDVRLCAAYCMKTREQGAALTETEALKELLIRFAMEGGHA